MYSISEEAKNILNSRYRNGFKSRITIGTDIFDNNIIQNISWSNGVIMDDNFEVGTAPMAQVTAVLMNKENAVGYNFEGKECYIEIGVVLSGGATEYIPLGYFMIEKAPRKNEYNITLTCVDRMYKFETLYTCGLTFPATLLQIAQDICSVAGVTLDNTSFVNSSYSLSTAPTLRSDLTCRKAIMAVAELAGGYAFIDRTGKLKIINANENATSVATITADNYSVLVNKELPLASIDKVVIGTEVRGTGSNPLIISTSNVFLKDPSAVIDNIYNSLNGFAYQPITMTWQGNPAIDCGDRLTVTDRNNNNISTLATSRTMSFNGGINEEYVSVGKSVVEKQSTPVSDMDYKINGAITEMHPKIYTGTTAPDASLGQEGDVYIQY